ncbi:Molybdopterin binding protein [Martensiomyces pterosporus]|nr:Molybdopterin binding protein [Martensiomyces pterosporus]
MAPRLLLHGGSSSILRLAAATGGGPSLLARALSAAAALPTSTHAAATKPLTAAFCVIGDEILNGKTLDTNSHHFAKRCFELGVEVGKIEVVPDSYESIASSVQQLSQAHDIVFTSGGIGPTHDDITYSAIARAFGKDLEYHQETLERMRRVMQQRRATTTLPDPQGTPEQVACARMALFPKSSSASYPCEEYWVPVVCVASNVHIFPGIPRLFQNLVDGYLPGLVAGLSDEPLQGFTRALVGTRLHESVVAPVLERLQERYAQESVRLGSYPNWPPKPSNSAPSASVDQVPLVVLSAVGKTKDQVEACKAELCRLLDGFELEGTSSDQ